MLTALFMLFSNSKYPFPFDVVGTVQTQTYSLVQKHGLIQTSKTARYFLPAITSFVKIKKNCGGGGILIAVKDIFIVTPVPELQTDCKIVWKSMSGFVLSIRFRTWHCFPLMD
jgi:hypothetical protein